MSTPTPSPIPSPMPSPSPIPSPFPSCPTCHGKGNIPAVVFGTIATILILELIIYFIYKYTMKKNGS